MRHRLRTAAVMCLLTLALVGCRNAGMNWASKAPVEPSEKAMASKESKSQKTAQNSDDGASNRRAAPEKKEAGNLKDLAARRSAKSAKSENELAGAEVAADAGGAASRSKSARNEKFDPVAEHLAQGRFEASRNHYDQARLHFSRVLQEQPDHAEAHHRLAVIADKQQKYSEAEMHYRAALQSNPDDANIYSDLGYSYLLQSRYRESEVALTEALRVAPQHSKAMNNLGMLYARTGDRDRALAVFRRIGTEEEALEKLARLERNQPASRSDAARPKDMLASGAAAGEMSPEQLRAAMIEARQSGRAARNLATGEPAGAPDPRGARPAAPSPDGRNLPASVRNEIAARQREAQRVPDHALNNVFSQIDGQASRPRVVQAEPRHFGAPEGQQNLPPAGNTVVPEMYVGNRLKTNPVPVASNPGPLDSNSVWPPSAEAARTAVAGSTGRPANGQFIASPSNPPAPNAGRPPQYPSDGDSQRMATMIGMGAGPGGMFPVLDNRRELPPQGNGLTSGGGVQPAGSFEASTADAQESQPRLYGAAFAPSLDQPLPVMPSNNSMRNAPAFPGERNLDGRTGQPLLSRQPMMADGNRMPQILPGNRPPEQNPMGGRPRMTLDPGYDENPQAAANAHWQMNTEPYGGRAGGSAPATFAQPGAKTRSPNGSSQRNLPNPQAELEETWMNRPTDHQPDSVPNQPQPAGGLDRRFVREVPPDRLSPVNPWNGRNPPAENGASLSEFRRQVNDHQREYNESLEQVEAGRRLPRSTAMPAGQNLNGGGQYYSATSDELRAYDEMRQEVGTRYQSQSSQPGTIDPMSQGRPLPSSRGDLGGYGAETAAPGAFRRSRPMDDSQLGGHGQY